MTLDRAALKSALEKLDMRQIQQPEGEVFVGSTHAVLTDEEHHALWQARHYEPEIIGIALNGAAEGEIVQVRFFGGALPEAEESERSLDYWRGYRHACRVLRESAEWSEKRADATVKMLESE